MTLPKGPEAKSPSLDYFTNLSSETFIYVVYQQKTTNGKYKIKLAKFNENGQKIFSLDVMTSTIDYTAIDVTPVIAVSYVYGLAGNKPKFLIVWRQHAEGSYQNGLYYKGGVDNGSTVSWYNALKFTSTDSQSSNPTIAVYKNPYSIILYHVAWQQGTTQIKYRGIGDSWDGQSAGGISEAGALETPSSGSGITINTNPSITVVNTNVQPDLIYDSPKLTWLASFYPQDFFAVFRDKSNSQYGTPWNNFHLYYSESDEIKSANINKTEEDNYFAFVYSEGSSNKYVKSTNLSSIQLLGTNVTNLQMSNGVAGWDGMDIIAYSNSSLPFTFSTAATVIFKNGIISEGRGGSVSRNSADFYFNFGDVFLDDNPVQLKDKNDTISISNSTLLNYYLETEPFSVNDNSLLDFTISYGVNDSSLAVNELGENELVDFKLEVIDNNSGLVLGTLKEVIQTQSSLNIQRNIDFRVNLSNVANRVVKLRLVEEDNLGNGNYTLLKIHSSNTGLMKSGFNEITLDGQLLVTDYALEQNYPNPFNPSTSINYQTPKDGFVTIKIYDVLGNEIKILVNEGKTTGRYEVNFDAGDLASGVYIYKIQVNDFVSVKKMLLLK